MPRFRKNDKIRVNGVDARVIAWPGNDEGPFRYATAGRNGVEIQSTAWISRSEIEGIDKPISEGGLGGPTVDVLGPSQVQLVEAAPKSEGKQVSPALIREMRREQAREDAQRAREEAQSDIKPWKPARERAKLPEPEPGEDPFIVDIEETK